MIHAIIFDFDGVIIETENKRFKDLAKILKDTKHILKPEYFANIIGKKTNCFLKEQFPNMSKKIMEEIIIARRKLQYSEISQYELIEGIRELLNFIKSKKYRIALTTGSKRDFVEQILEVNNLSNFFEIIVSGDDFNSSKPNSECYEITLDKLNLSSSEVIVIEDSVPGIESAKSLGCIVFGITTSETKYTLFKANKIFKNHVDLLQYLRHNNL